jgi:hypothetical protein
MNPQNNQLPAINGVQPASVPAAANNSDVQQPHQAAPSQQTPQVSQQQPMASMPSIADDADLIEKEWVLKAKQIVEETKNDPYAQNQEMNRMKADYIKKRYNKEVKLEES